MSHQPRPNPPPRQRGAALLVALTFLIVLTFLGLSTIGTSTNQERMARFSRDQNVALQAAEAALRDAEKEVLLGLSERAPGDSSGVASADCGSGQFVGFCLSRDSGTPVWLDPAMDDPSTGTKWVSFGSFTWLDAGGTKSLTLPEDVPGGVSKQPEYIVEQMPTPPEGSEDLNDPMALKKPWRVTVRGYGADEQTRVVLQTVVRAE